MARRFVARLATLVATCLLLATPIAAQSVDRGQLISADADLAVTYANVASTDTGLPLSDSDAYDSSVATKYPVVIAPHWGDPPKGTHYDCVIAHLRGLGAEVHVPSYSKGYLGTPDRACELKRFILCLMNDSACARAWRQKYPGEPMKVNIVAHSKGTLDSRYMISNLGMGDKVASWTGLAGPAGGTPIADRALRLLGPILPRDFRKSVISLSERYTQCEFRAEDVEGVYYQSWGAVVFHYYPGWSHRDRRLWKYLLRQGYENDMWIPVSSQKKNPGYRGTLIGDGYYGVHHQAFLGPKYYPNPGFNAYDFWANDVLADLKARGF